MEEHGNSTIAKSFLADIKPLITHYGLFFLTVDDLNTFFEHQDFYDLFKQYLQQHHNATQKDKKEAARLVVFGPEHPIDNIAERLNCFNTNTNVNSSDVHYVTLYVYQPDPLLEISYVDSKRNAGHTWLGISQVAQGQATELNVGLYPESAANPWEQDDPGKYSDGLFTPLRC